MDHLLRDLRYAVHSLSRAPAFTLAVMVVLALGIGANLAVFSVVNAVLLRPLPYDQPERLVQLYETFPVSGGQGRGSVSYPNFLDWKEQSRAFDGLALAGIPTNVTMQGGDEPQRLLAVPVGGALFDVLGTAPLLGRGLVAADDDPSGPRAAVLSEDLWRRSFGADSEILGRVMVLDGEAHTVVGVMPAGFRFPAASSRVGLWAPLRPGPNQVEARGSHWFQVIGRLRPGVPLETAEAEMRQIAARLELEHPSQEGRSAMVVPMRQDVVGSVRSVLLLILGAAGLVLLIACANVASLLLARATTQRREVAIRSALGADRSRIFAQYLVQSLVLTTLGAAAGLMLASGAVAAVPHLAAGMLPRAGDIGFDGPVVAFLLAISTASAVIFGVIPVLRTSRLDLSRSLREGGRTGSGGPGGQAARAGLVVAQISLSLVLLVSAGLLLRTFVSLMRVETGMQAERVLTTQLAWNAGADHERVTRFWDPLLEVVRALPGVHEAGLISHLPLDEWGFNGNFGIVGRDFESRAATPFAEFRVASPGYFAALGIPVLRGRDLSASDHPDAPRVALINRRLAERYFAGEDPLGQQLVFGDGEPLTVVGVVGDVRQARLDMPPLAEVYLPLAQRPDRAEMTLVVATSSRPAALTGALRQAVSTVDPGQSVGEIRTMQQVVSGSVADRRLYLWLVGSFALAALVLVIAGIYGTIAYGVAQRTREIGIRLALGSDPETTLRLIMWGGARLAVLGVAIGLPAAFFVARLLEAQLVGVSAGDPATYAAVGMLLLTVSLAASFLPGRRAARVDPMVALREE